MAGESEVKYARGMYISIGSEDFLDGWIAPSSALKELVAGVEGVIVYLPHQQHYEAYVKDVGAGDSSSMYVSQHPQCTCIGICTATCENLLKGEFCSAETCSNGK